MNLEAFFPAELANRLPHPWDDSARSDDALIFARFYSPTTNKAWYVKAYDRHNREFFGIIGHEDNRLGYFSLEELYRWRETLGVIRDVAWKAQCAEDIFAEILAIP